RRENSAMAAHKKPRSICVSNGHGNLDRGTLCKQRSPSAGSVGGKHSHHVAVPAPDTGWFGWATDHTADAFDWVKDHTVDAGSHLPGFMKSVLLTLLGYAAFQGKASYSIA